MRDEQLTEQVIGSAFAVQTQLGCGFLEKVYEHALAHEVRKRGLDVVQQAPMQVKYDGVVVGEYLADLLIERRLLVELKVVKELADVHLAQCLNYLKATRLNTCLLMNFAKPRLEFKRISL
jgi:GxxExxY protein